MQVAWSELLLLCHWRYWLFYMLGSGDIPATKNHCQVDHILKIQLARFMRWVLLGCMDSVYLKQLTICGGMDFRPYLRRVARDAAAVFGADTVGYCG